MSWGYLLRSQGLLLAEEPELANELGEVAEELELAPTPSHSSRLIAKPRLLQNNPWRLPNNPRLIYDKLRLRSFFTSPGSSLTTPGSLVPPGSSVMTAGWVFMDYLYKNSPFSSSLGKTVLVYYYHLLGLANRARKREVTCVPMR